MGMSTVWFQTIYMMCSLTFLYSQLLLLPYEYHLRFFLFIINTVLLSQFIIIFVVSLLEIVALKEI